MEVSVTYFCNKAFDFYLLSYCLDGMFLVSQLGDLSQNLLSDGDLLEIIAKTKLTRGSYRSTSTKCVQF